MRIFQEAIIRWYYWNDKNLKYLHEKVLRNNIGIYKGFFDEYGQALRIDFMNFICEKDIVENIYISDHIRKNMSRRNNEKLYKYILDSDDAKRDIEGRLSFAGFIELFYNLLLDEKLARAG